MESSLPPKIAVVGSPRDPLSASSAAVHVFGNATNVRYVGPSPTALGGVVRQFAGPDMGLGDVDLIHLLDARLAPLGHRLQRRYEVPVTATVSRPDLACGGRLIDSLRQLDGVFAETDIVSRVQGLVGGVCVTPLPLSARALPTPSARAVRSLQRALRGTEPGRFVLALPAPMHAGQLEWFCEGLLPQLSFSPICLLLGDLPRERTAAVKRTANVGRLHVLHGSVDADLIAAVARCADAFIVLWVVSPEQSVTARTLLLMASSGVPLIVARGLPGGGVVEHERNGLTLDDACADDWASVLSDLFSLPPLQRQFVGEDFMRNTLDRAPVAAVRDAYYERFDELLGRYTIPAQLRAA